MKILPDKSVDMILCDLPYGVTQNKWDSVIDLPPLWLQYERIIKDNGCIALFAQSPFDKVLGCSNLKLFKYEWIIEKTKATNFLNSRIMPMRAHEQVLIFYKKVPTYNPQFTEGHKPVNAYTKHTTDGNCYGKTKSEFSGGGSTKRYPRDVLKFKWDTQTTALHPTQKPVALMEYFIKTYTEPGETVLDNCMGSGSTGVACVRTGREFIGIELEKQYYDIAFERIHNELRDQT